MKDGNPFSQLSYPSQSLSFFLLSFCVYNMEQLQRKYIPPVIYFGTKGGMDRDILGCDIHMEVTFSITSIKFQCFDND